MLRSGLEGARPSSAFDSPAPRVATFPRVAAARRRSDTRLRVAVLATAFFLLVSWALACCVAWGQARFEEAPASAALLADKKKQGELKGLVTRILNGSEPLEPNRSSFEGWYRAFVFPQMTHLDKLPELADNRETLLRNDLANAKNEEARQVLVRIAFEEMKKIAAGNYHPGARYNAMLIIGELNQTEGIVGSTANARPPRPLPAARQTLLEEWQKPNASDAMLVACLLGVRRHIDVDRVLPADQKMDAASKKQIYDGAMALLKAPAPETRKPLAHAYLKTLATDIVAYVGDPGPNGETISALDAVIDDPESPDFLKSAAMTAIGQMNLPATYADQTPALLRSFAEASFGFLLHEIEALNAEKQYRVDFVTKPTQGQSGGYESMMPSYGLDSSYGMGSESGVMMGPDGRPLDPNKPRPGPLAKERDYVIENSRRRLKAYMVDAQRALRGRNPQEPAGLAKLATKPEEQEIVKAFDDELDEVIDSTEDPELTIIQLIDALNARAAAMQTALGVVPPTDPADAATEVSTPAADPANGAAPAADAAGPGARGPGGRGPGARGPGARGPRAPAAPGSAAGTEGADPAGEAPAPTEETPAPEPAAAP